MPFSARSGSPGTRSVTHLISRDAPVDGPADDPRALAVLADGLASAADVWGPRVRHDPQLRCYERIAATPAYDAWLIGWTPGQAIPAHDHGASAGAIVVTDGQLVETRWSTGAGRPDVRAITAGERPHVFGAAHLHAVANLTNRSASSIHVYSPPLSSMRFYDRDDPEPTTQLVTRTASHGRSLDTLLAQARARIHPVEPAEARAAVVAGALVIDIRPDANRRAEGEIPDAVVVERNVLEWRLDPASPDKIPEITGYDQQIILVCNEGYASSLAAATLVDLGLVHATDLAGGFRAWQRAGLPIVGAPPTA